MKKVFFIFFVVFFLTQAALVLAQDVEIDFFYSDICSHCAAEKEFLAELEQKYPDLVINKYEVISNTKNQKILQGFYERYQVPEGRRGWVPVTFTPDEYFIGFNPQIAKELETCLEHCMGRETTDSQKITLPFFGQIDVGSFSLPVLTVIFGALDGFNPCAMWVLLFLIVLLMNTKSRKRMWLVGGIFILTSGIVYFLILSAWLNLFLAISYVNITRILIGLLALGVGLWQVRNFLRSYPATCKFFGEQSGFQERTKEKFKIQAEKIATSPFTFALLAGIVLLALGVNLVEFFCSAGLPAIYTRILTLSEVGSTVYYLYLLLYTFIFMLDDIIIFSLAVITLNKLGFTEKYNYWATLFGGVLIILLGILLIFKPELLMFS